MDITADVLIVGTGVSGLYCALNLPKDKKIIMITKAELEESDSFLAQGGICVQRNDNDFDSYFEDTMRAGHYENDKESVRIMINSSRDVIKDLIAYGVDFERKDGELCYTREGAHSAPRILYHEDETGKAITSKLLEAAKGRSNIKILDNFAMLDIIEDEGKCIGIVGKPNNGDMQNIFAKYTVLATGGIGGLFRHSTNFLHLTGDSLAICLKHGIELENIDYIQIHPTTLYSKKKGRRFLISESVRGEGAKLLNAKGERFIDELLPRDVVANAIHEQMKKDNKPYVWLDMRPVGEAEIKKHFPNIYKQCLEEGYDATKECIPVVPAQHYFMGGIKVNKESKTSMEDLYAVGETACNGVHGKNRLASNSLLESLVFAKRAAKDMAKQIDEKKLITKDIDAAGYADCNKNYGNTVLKEIERKRNEHNNNEAECGQAYNECA